MIGEERPRRAIRAKAFVVLETASEYVDHYRDAWIESSTDDSKIATTSTGGVTVAFPQKLHALLSAAETEGFQDIITWQPHGRAFLILDKSEFVSTIMPRYVDSTCDTTVRSGAGRIPLTKWRLSQILSSDQNHILSTTTQSLWLCGTYY